MKTKLIFLACMIISIIALGQNEKVEEMKNVLEKSEVEVNPPIFTGIENFSSIQKNEALESFLSKNVSYPEEAMKYHAEGRVIVQFVVTPSGELTDFIVINSVSSEIDQEIIDVLKTTNGMWRPGLNSGEPVAMQKEVSIVFKMGYSKYEAAQNDFVTKAKIYFIKANKKLLLKGKAKSALHYYDNCMMLVPYDKSLLLMRGLCRFELGDKSGAHQDWRRLKSLGGIDAEIKYLADDVRGAKGYSELLSVLEKE